MQFALEVIGFKEDEMKAKVVADSKQSSGICAIKNSFKMRK